MGMKRPDGTAVIQKSDGGAQTTMVAVKIWRSFREACWGCLESKTQLWDRPSMKMRRREGVKADPQVTGLHSWTKSGSTLSQGRWANVAPLRCLGGIEGHVFSRWRHTGEVWAASPLR